MAKGTDKPCPGMAEDGRKPSGAGRKSDAVREQAILALLSEKSLSAAAERSGVSERALRRWMAEDGPFKSELAEARRALFQTGMNRIQALTGEAVETLAALMGPETPAAVRLGAARTVAELGVQRHDAETIMQKLDEIEAYQRQRETRR